MSHTFPDPKADVSPLSDHPRRLCVCCYKQSDAGVGIEKVVLCGTCFDAWLASPERRLYAYRNGENDSVMIGRWLAEFIRQRQAEVRNSTTGKVA